MAWILTLCNDSKENEHEGNITYVGDPTETALVEFARPFGFDKNECDKKYPRVGEIPFDSDRKLMTTVHEEDGKFIVYTKGGVDELLSNCNSYILDGEIKQDLENYKETIKKYNMEMAQNALRVLAMGYKVLDHKPTEEDKANLESGLTYIGMVGMIDPPRLEVKDAVAKCKSAGIKTVMITGDHKITATAIAKKLGYSPVVILLAMIGGGKAGNIVSPNPNTISAAENFGVNLSSLMAANIIPAIIGLVVTVILATLLAKKFKATSAKTQELEDATVDTDLPSFFASIVGPLVAIILLSLVGIAVDPLIALPVGGIVGVIAMGKFRHLNEYITFGLSKMMPVAILLIGTGTVAGIIKASTLQTTTISMLNALHMPSFLLAPISGILMSAATASTTSGATIASATFGSAIISSLLL